jgi:hypothetical protein
LNKYPRTLSNKEVKKMTITKGGRIRFLQYACVLEISKYRTGELRLELVDEDDFSPVATASVLVPGLLEGEVAIKDYSENEGMLQTLLDARVIASPHRYVTSGYVIIPVTTLL